MIWLAIALQALFYMFAFVVRSFVHFRQTGGAGFRAFAQTRSMPERAAVLLITAGGALSLLGSSLAGVLPAIDALDGNATRFAGAIVAGLALALIVWAQLSMGESWRIGVDTSEVTELVTRGPFRVVRNPIFSGMLLFWIGAAFVAPNVLSLMAPVAALAGIQLQVRMVEEPYLTRTHGEAYRRYAAEAGRFMPIVGRLRGIPAT